MTAVIGYFYSVASGYSYLGAGRFYELAARSGRRVNHKPLYLSIVLAGTGGVPFQERHPARLKQMAEDLRACGAYLGIPINPDPSHHYDPIETASGMVAALILRGGDPARLSFLMQQALWRDDRSLADPAVLDELAAESGLDGPDLRASALDRECQELLRQNSREAVALGVIGAPSYLLEGRIFFGQDRLPLLEAALAGRL